MEPVNPIQKPKLTYRELDPKITELSDLLIREEPTLEQAVLYLTDYSKTLDQVYDIQIQLDYIKWDTSLSDIEKMDIKARCKILGERITIFDASLAPFLKKHLPANNEKDLEKLLACKNKEILDLKQELERKGKILDQIMNLGNGK